MLAPGPAAPGVTARAIATGRRAVLPGVPGWMETGKYLVGKEAQESPAQALRPGVHLNEGKHAGENDTCTSSGFMSLGPNSTRRCHCLEYDVPVERVVVLNPREDACGGQGWRHKARAYGGNLGEGHVGKGKGIKEWVILSPGGGVTDTRQGPPEESKSLQHFSNLYQISPEAWKCWACRDQGLYQNHGPKQTANSGRKAKNMLCSLCAVGGAGPVCPRGGEFSVKSEVTSNLVRSSTGTTSSGAMSSPTGRFWARAMLSGVRDWVPPEWVSRLQTSEGARTSRNQTNSQQNGDTVTPAMAFVLVLGGSLGSNGPPSQKQAFWWAG